MVRFCFGSTVVQVGRICSVKYENRGSNCLSNAARYPIHYCISEYLRASSLCFPDKSKMLIKIRLEHWWDGADRGRRKYRVIHKSLRDFRTRLHNNQDRHGRKEHINR